MAEGHWSCSCCWRSGQDEGNDQEVPGDRIGEDDAHCVRPDEGSALCNGNSGGNAMTWLDTLGLQSVEASEQYKRLNVPAITLDASLLDRDNDEMSSSLLSSHCCGLWTIQDFLPRWCHAWEGGGGRGLDGVREEAGRRVLLICRERRSGPGGA
jgi:hypothetical protein